MVIVTTGELSEKRKAKRKGRNVSNPPLKVSGKNIPGPENLPQA